MKKREKLGVSRSGVGALGWILLTGWRDQTLLMSRPSPANKRYTVNDIIRQSRRSIATLACLTVALVLPLIALGAAAETELSWPMDYQDFSGMFAELANAYAGDSLKEEFVLDFEYKKIAPGQLIVKQVREIPRRDTWSDTKILATDGPVVFTSGNARGAFGTHRIKCRLTLEPRPARLNAADLSENLFQEATFEYLDGDRIAVVSGEFPFNNGTHELVGEDPLELSDTWSFGEGSNRRNYELTTTFREDTSDRPVVMGIIPRLTVDYATPVWDPSTNGYEHRDEVGFASGTSAAPETKSTAFVVTNLTRRVTLRFTARNDLSIVPSIEGNRYSLNCVNSLASLQSAEIEGLTSKPLHLTDFFSTTRGSQRGAHNSWPVFLFQPRLDPDTDAEQLAELESRNIEYIFIAPQIYVGVSIGEIFEITYRIFTFPKIDGM